MRGKTIVPLAILALVFPVLGAVWEQTSWVDGELDDPGEVWNDDDEENHRRFFDSEDLAWWRFVVDPGTGDNHVFPYAPSDNSDDDGEFGIGLENMQQITCRTNYLDANSGTLYQVVGGQDENGRPAVYYSEDNGETWTKNAGPNYEGTVIGVAQRPNSRELHLVTNVDETFSSLRIYILDSLDDTTWDQHTEVALTTGSCAHFLFDDSDYGHLTVSDVSQMQARYWIWDEPTWDYHGNDFPLGLFQLYDIWRMGHDNHLFVAVDNDFGYDVCYYSVNDGEDWQEWDQDYFDGSVNSPQFAAVGPLVWDEEEHRFVEYVYLASSGEGTTGEMKLVRIEKESPDNFEPLDPPSGLGYIHGVLVGDDGVVFLSGKDTGNRAGLWYSTDNGREWAGGPLDDGLDGLADLPVLLQDPRFGFLYLSGNWPDPGDVPFIVFMAHREAEIVSLPYDCKSPSTFINVDIELLEDNHELLKVYLRSANNPEMNGARPWGDCEPIPYPYDDLEDIDGLNQGDQFVQYRLVFNALNDVPLSFPVVNAFRLRYEGEEGGPRVDKHVPPDGAEGIPLDAVIRVFFTRPMDLGSFEGNFFIHGAGDEIDWDGWLEGEGYQFVARPLPELPPRTLIEVMLDNDITDTEGNPLEDDNGDRPGAYDFSFTTGGEGDYDDEPPEVTDIKANPNPTFGADQINLTCKADDTEHGGSLIAGGEYFIDNAGLDGEGKPMIAGDGDLDDPFEELLAVVDTSGWAEGSTHVLYVHAVDAAYNWSPLQTIVVETEGVFLDPERVYVWPNPATDAAHFAFTVGGNARVRLSVYDLAGRLVHSEEGDFTIGRNDFVWDLAGVASDAYVFRIAAEETDGLGRTAFVVKKLAVVR
jgi:hypothetical protein